MGFRYAEENPEAYRFPLTIDHLLTSAVATAPTQQIVHRDRSRHSYAEFADRVARLAAGLVGLGAEPGMTVSVLDWDSNRYLECYFAVPMLGAVLHTVNIRLTPDEILYTLKHAEARILVVHTDFADMVEALRPELGDVRVLPIAGDADALSRCGYERLLAASEPHDFARLDENAIATTFYTTGTTGLPKAVSFSHRQILLHTLSTSVKLASQVPLGMGQSDVYMPMTPMFHGHAWGMPYAATLMGLKQVYPGRYDPVELLDLRAREGATFSHCVPTILQMLLEAARTRGERLDGWRMAIGGSALTGQLLREAREMGATIFAGFGLSEAGPNLTLSRPAPDSEDGDARLTMAGIPFPLVEARLLDGAGAELPHDGISEGELVVRAPWLAQGYGGDRDASRALWQGGWMHTQDVATIDPLGYVQIRDRLKDVIKSGGEWISSLHLESLIHTMDAVKEVAVIAVPDRRWGERPAAVIVPQDPAKPVSLAAIRAHLDPYVRDGSLSRFALPDRVVTSDALPRTSVGKIDKKKLRGACAGLTAPSQRQGETK
ncbi:MAG: hypothetical protein QOH81_649 [Sphingomonadales bacterium]|jgi:fatty-acyl-CoA synthase|nr:hypothetical protein [Sphingomonadales bacterium]